MVMPQIRKTQKDDVMFEFKNPSLGGTDPVCNQAPNLPGENATVRANKHEISMQCKDIYEATSTRRICSLKEQFRLEDLGVKSMVSLRKGYGSTRTAAMRLTVQAMQTLLTARGVRMG